MDDLPINSIVQSTDPNTVVTSTTTNMGIQEDVQTQAAVPPQTTLQIDLNNTLNKVNSLVSSDSAVTPQPIQTQPQQQIPPEAQSVPSAALGYTSASKFGMPPQQEHYSVAEVKPAEETTAEVFSQEQVAEKEPVSEIVKTEQPKADDQNTPVEPMPQSGQAGTVVDLRTPVASKQKIHTISDVASGVTLEADKEEQEFIDGILDNHAT